MSENGLQKQNTELAKQQEDAKNKMIHALVIKGDLSGLSEIQTVDYYRHFCANVGLDPMTQPFKLLELDGKKIMYCDRGGAAQLNRLHSISHSIIKKEVVDGNYEVTARATDKDGRYNEATGIVPLVKEGGEWKTSTSGKKFFQGNGTYENLKPLEIANAKKKAETQAKRRATLDLCGLGMLETSEVEDIEFSYPGSNFATSDAINPFKIVYDNIDELEAVLNTSVTLGDLQALYTSNTGTVEANPDLKSKFSALKEKLDPKKNPTPDQAAPVTHEIKPTSEEKKENVSRGTSAPDEVGEGAF